MTCEFCGLDTPRPCATGTDDCPHAPGAVVADGPLAGLKKWHYGAICADPPWSFKTYSNRDQGTVPHRTEAAPYLSMTHEELLALPVAEIAAKDCLLHMWTISSHVDQSIALAAAWGFTFKSLGLVWVKTQKGNPEVPKMGMGKWFRQEAEVALLFTRGKPTRLDAGVRQTILEPAREHSRKPDDALARIERLVAGPYAELFSRTPRTGWDQMGNQKTMFAPRDADLDEDALAMI